MRYRFRGAIRDTGKPVEGHVEAVSVDQAFELLGQAGIVGESAVPDPKALNLGPELPTDQHYTSAIDSAMDASSTQVEFDSLVDRYKGKKVWVIDRDKIRTRVAQVVDTALAESMADSEDGLETRIRVATAIHDLFQDNRNIATERNAPLPPGQQAPGGLVAAGMGSAGLEQQIDRLGRLVSQAEAVMAALSLAVRTLGSGALRRGGPATGVYRRTMDKEQDQVLFEIFKQNLELARSLPGMEMLNSAAPAQFAAVSSDDSVKAPT